MSSSSFLPMIVAHLLIRAILFLRAISITISQYSLARLLISSDAQINFTLESFIPAAFQISTKYLPTFLIFSKSPKVGHVVSKGGSRELHFHTSELVVEQCEPVGYPKNENAARVDEFIHVYDF